jgi:hypothetical protein
MLPSIPAGTTAAFANTSPPGEFRVEMPGKGTPADQVDRKSSGPVGTAVMLKEKTRAEEGTPQEDEGIGKLRIVYGDRRGGPNAPVLC